MSHLAEGLRRKGRHSTSSRLASDLRRAVENEDLHLAYQPIIDLSDGTTHAVEALSRWEHPALGPIGPTEFVAIAERSSTIHKLTAWALRTACADLAQWQAIYPSAVELAVAVNVSSTCFGDVKFVEIVAETLARTNVHPRHLILELTETAAADPATTLLGNAARLRRMGVRIALDDFGVGYSSLGRLATVPITDLKLDRTLTSPALEEVLCAALLRATMGLATDLGINLIAEGVEIAAQLDLLRRQGCRYVQGNLLAMPRPAEIIAAELALLSGTFRS
ncbi:MAG TPA: EAL domain-containing protein [Jatrophihabitans sp.]|nr:EAL domain-containing protein [Jatrophihabitans sp.]